MIIVALLLLLILVAVAVVLAVQNFALLLTSVHLTFLSVHLPGIPWGLLVLFGVCLGGLLLYVVSTFSARHDAKEIKALQKTIDELQRAQEKAPSGPLTGGSGQGAGNFGQPASAFGSQGPQGSQGVPNSPNAGGNFGPPPASSAAPGSANFGQVPMPGFGGPANINARPNGPSQFAPAPGSVPNIPPSSSGLGRQAQFNSPPPAGGIRPPFAGQQDKK